MTPRLAAFVVTRLGGLKEGGVASIRILPGLRVSREILTSRERSIDKLARPVSYPGAPVPFGILHEVRAKLAVLIGRLLVKGPPEGLSGLAGSALGQRGSSRNVVGRTSARTIDCA